jgi:hypothetical protein
MDPEGILKAWMIKVRIKKARTRAIMMASVYSRMVDLGEAGCDSDTLTVPEMGILIHADHLKTT